MAYDDCCSGGCGELATTEEEWLQALTLLATDDELRYSRVVNAQRKVSEEYSLDGLRAQILEVFEMARGIRREGYASPTAAPADDRLQSSLQSFAVG
jgi:hypothetical protein